MIIEGVLNSLSNLLFFALHLSSASSFPPPLSAKDEREYLVAYKNGDINAKNKLIEHNLRLVAHIIKKYYSNSAHQDDLISIGTIGLIKAINTFDVEKGTRLATYAARCVENEILMYFRAQKKTAQDVSVNEPIDTDSEGNPLTLMDIIATEDEIIDDIYKMTMIKKLRGEIKKIDNPRERTIIILRYGLDGNKPLTQLEVSERLNISRSYVSRIEKKVLTRLKKALED
ncbi:MAG: RNA polymerase sporulation sigma factor SigK [Acutalibacteraceae bacterium]|nr:RNA polymerase sporulation sigma factor SigK [Acutalibacteraceae bacterium]